MQNKENFAPRVWTKKTLYDNDGKQIKHGAHFRALGFGGIHFHLEKQCHAMTYATTVTAAR